MKISNKKIKVFILFAVISSIPASFAFSQSSDIITSPGAADDLYDLKTSDGEITIITPENKAYTEPMSGYYPATFGFENDLNGVIPLNWIDSSSPPCYAKIINDIGGHNKVIEVYGRGQTSSDYAFISNSFPPQTSGTIEWWWRKSSTLSSCAKFHVSNDTNELIDLRMDWYSDPGKIEYEENGWVNTGYSDFADDKWIHMNLSFDCTTDVYSLTIDGVLYLNNIPFHNGDLSTYISRIQFYTYAASNPTLYYVDAVGYSWDINYDVGDNLNEGLLLSYENTTSLDWKAYSLDGQMNNTILGNKTLPMPSNGLHSIQVFGNDSIGTMYESNVRYFTMNADTFINIITPEDITYFEPMSGYYPATFGFENDLNGAIPLNWVDTSSPPCYAKIINDIGGHNKVMEVYGRGQTSSDYAIINNYFQPQTSGTIEWWWRKSSTLSSCAKLMVSNDTNELIDLRMDWYADPGKIEYEENGWVNTGYPDYADDKWIHMKLSFDCTTDEYSLTIDGVLYLNNIPFHNGDLSTYISRIQFYTYAASNPTLYYVDAVGYSWDLNYDVGDNLNEGLLLSYSNTTNMEWVGYSLDGSPNITITGNKIIPFPEIGSHSIILNGITSIGMLTKSELRYFTIDIQDPPIPPEIPSPFPIIPIILASIGIGIIALLSITIIFFRRNKYSRTSSTIISHKKSQLDEVVVSGSDQFKVCPFCRTQIKKNNQFCTYCGASLKDD